MSYVIVETIKLSYVGLWNFRTLFEGGRSSCLPIPGTQDVISRNDMCLKCWSIMGDSNLYEVLDILCTKCENTFTINNNGYGFIISEIAKECKKCDTCSKLFI